MKMKLITIGIVILLASALSTARADDPGNSIPEDFLSKFANDLSELHEPLMELDELQNPPVYVYPTNPATALVSVDSAMLRTEPSESASLIGTLDQGFPLTIIGQDSGWLKVISLDGRQGWIKEDQTDDVWSDFDPETYVDPEAYSVKKSNRRTGVTAHVISRGTYYPTTNTEMLDPRVWQTGNEPIHGQSAEAKKSLSQKLILQLVTRASEFRDAYRDNPYIEVTGFSLNLAISPSIGMNFGFKDTQQEESDVSPVATSD